MSKKKKPFVLVTVSGGVASAWVPDGVEWDIVDWDSFERDLPTQDEIDWLKRVAKRLPTPADKRVFREQIQELEKGGLADEI